MRTKQSKANREARAAGKARQVRSSALGKLLIMLAVVAAIVFGVAIFFKVNTIEIQGNTVYSADQIIEASQIQQGDNLLTVNKALAVGNIKAALPYVEDVSIARSLPDGIIIQVRESVVSFAVMTDTNACWLVGPSGKALERIEPAAFNENPHINGLLISTPTEGEAVSSPTPTALAAALADMAECAEGTLFLDTAEHIVLLQSAGALLPAAAQQPQFRPAAKLYLARLPELHAAEAVEFLQAHPGTLTLALARAALVRGDQIRPAQLLPAEDGGMKLAG